MSLSKIVIFSRFLIFTTTSYFKFILLSMSSLSNLNFTDSQKANLWCDQIISVYNTKYFWCIMLCILLSFVFNAILENRFPIHLLIGYVWWVNLSSANSLSFPPYLFFLSFSHLMEENSNSPSLPSQKPKSHLNLYRSLPFHTTHTLTLALFLLTSFT